MCRISNILSDHRALHPRLYFNDWTTSLFQFKAHQFKAPFWQKLPPKKNWYKALFCRAEIYLLKKEVIFDCNWRLIWSDRSICVFPQVKSVFFYNSSLFYLKKVIFSWFLKKWMTENLILLLLTAVSPCRLPIFKIYQDFLKPSSADFFWKISDLRHLFEDFGHQKVCLK